jgi:hypothetical protein
MRQDLEVGQFPLLRHCMLPVVIRLEVDLLYLCYSEAALNKVSRWIGSGPRTTLTVNTNVDIMTSIIECIRERVLRGARTFVVKYQSTLRGTT